MKRAMTKAGAAVPSPNRLVLLRDTDHDGSSADDRTTFLTGLNSPFGHRTRRPRPLRRETPTR
jgi:glucose/arabinose dehydrogenase